MAAVTENPGDAVQWRLHRPRALVAFAPGDQRGATVPARTLARVVLEEPEATLVVNPVGPQGGRLSRRDLERLADGLVPTAEGLASAAADGSLRVLPLARQRADDLVEAVGREAAGAAGRELWRRPG